MTSGGLSIQDSTTCVGVSRSTIARMCRQGRLTAQKRGREWVIDAGSVEALRQERSRWVSQETAGRLVGLSTPTIRAAVRRGEFTLRDVNHALPSLDRTEVLRWAENRRQREERRAVERLERQQATQPPDDGRVWFDVETAAAVLGCSPRWVRVLAQEGRLPHVRRGRHLWFVREHLETVNAARAFRHAQRDAHLAAHG
jgi:excisionase family DNA binding protein